MSRHTLLRQLALVSAISGAIFATSATAGLFTLSGSGATSSFPNAIKFGGKLECNLPNLGIYIDTDNARLVLTDKDALDPSFNPDFPPPTQAVCTETISGSSVQGTGWFQQLAKSGTINAGGGQGPNPTGLVVQETLNGDGTTTYTLRFYVDDRGTTDEVARYRIDFDDPENNPLCADGNGGFFNPCVHKMGLPDPINSGESEVTKGGTTFPAEAPFAQYVMEQMSVTKNALGNAIAFTDFQARWLHNGSENDADPILDSVKVKGQLTPLRTTVESTVDYVEFLVSPVVTSTTGVKPIHVLSSADFDATVIQADRIEVNGKTVMCRNTSTVDVNGDGRNDWRCGAEALDFVVAANLLQNCTSPATATFAVRFVFEGKARTARDLESTFPVNCN